MGAVIDIERAYEPEDGAAVAHTPAVEGEPPVAARTIVVADGTTNSPVVSLPVIFVEDNRSARRDSSRSKPCSSSTSRA